MLARTLLLATALACSATAQVGKSAPFSDPPPKAKVVSTPKPATTPVKRKRPAPAKRAEADPLADYMPTVKAAFSARWADAATPHLADFSPGELRVTFKLDAEGKVTAFAVAANTSNEAFAKFCEQFVRETTFEKPPEKSLVEGAAEIPFTFSIY